MEADGWIEHSTKDGQRLMTYDAEINTKEETIKKGYKNVESVADSGYYQAGNESYELSKDGAVKNEDTGERFDVTKDAFRAKNGTYFAENKSNLSKFGDLFSNSGDAAVVVGTVMLFTGVGTPVGAALVTYGGYASTAGTVIGLVDDANKGKLTTEKVVTKGAMSVIPMGGGKVAKQIGESRIEDVINITTMGADKVIDAMRDTKSGPYREN